MDTIKFVSSVVSFWNSLTEVCNSIISTFGGFTFIVMILILMRLILGRDSSSSIGSIGNFFIIFLYIISSGSGIKQEIELGNAININYSINFSRVLPPAFFGFSDIVIVIDLLITILAPILYVIYTDRYKINTKGFNTYNTMGYFTGQAISIKLIAYNYKIFYLINHTLGKSFILQSTSVILYEIFRYEYFLIWLLIWFLTNNLKSRSSERHSLERHYPERHSPERHSQERHSLEKHSLERHSPERHSSEETISNLLYALSLYATFGIIFIGLKFSINSPRPFCSLNDYYTIFNTANIRCLSSFPSAHTGMAVVYGYLIYRFRLLSFCLKTKLKRIVFWSIIAVVVICVGVSRMILAMHYPIDIFFGGLLGLLAIQLTNWISKRKIYEYLSSKIIKNIK